MINVITGQLLTDDTNKQPTVFVYMHFIKENVLFTKIKGKTSNYFSTCKKLLIGSVLVINHEL